ncbi:tRNA (N6-threonylcarbamoyladenosine(37)-N6)-methyltransferase TrmO [Nannocystis bainbridge]|uniref:tRNA (N6-threonylcarbamoyladenosine(37)-N6)-methyltransferase TrmO n=1 Tax=Nannocystis bainbridge TaxID=2995303 RepID=A0ABT5DRB6_9BACT|nr:tRNA (N6-threonylcarbamoyladenosine(37)-N6)-methyltransferase TrmO [Nannocystis bainbridge]MDC0716091.1 tRNA (N6-threonylcarbamoyladenosine(37)-N6)-methyltransferase TrmO [Nannocystis bainbridge]
MRRSIPEQDHTTGRDERPSFSFAPIGVVRSPYTERFGTPRQPTITTQVKEDRALPGRIEVLPEFAAGLQDLAEFERIWCLFVFHLNQGYGLKVRSPRDPGRSVGLFSTRAPHRPSPIGLSCLRITAIEAGVVHVLGLDILDGTPVLDLKPYVPYADAFPDARAGWLEGRVQDEPDAFRPR